MDKELYTGYCPNCDYKIDYNKNDKTVQCPACDMNFSVNSLAKSLDVKAASHNHSGFANLTSLYQAIETPESGLAYLENFFETYDWEEFYQTSKLSIHSISVIVEKQKVTNAASANTWLLEFNSIFVPLMKKIEGIKILEKEMAEKFNPVDDTNIYDAYDNYCRIVRSLLTNKEDLMKTLLLDIKYAEKYALSPDQIDDMKQRVVLLNKKYDTIQYINSPQEIPLVANKIHELEQEIVQDLASKGIKAEEVYNSAVNLFLHNNDKTLALQEFYKIKYYKDSSKYIYRINRLFNYNNTLYEIGGLRFTSYLDKIEPLSLEVKGNNNKVVQDEYLSQSQKGVTFGLYEIVNSIPSKTPAVKGISEIICIRGSNLFYIKNNSSICSYNTVTRQEHVLNVGKPHDYKDVNNKYTVYFSNDGKQFFLRKKLTINVVQPGCIARLLGKKPEVIKENNNYSVVLVDTNLLSTTTILGAVVDILDYFDDKIFYSVYDEFAESKEKFMMYDLNSKLSKQVLDVNCVIHKVHDNKVIYSRLAPNLYNTDLHCFDLTTEKDVLLEDNAYNFFDVIDNKVYYTVGNDNYEPLYSINFDGTNRHEILPSVVEVLFIRAGWMYVLKAYAYDNKGNVVSDALVKISVDGTRRITLCSRIKKFIKFVDGYVYYLDDSNDLHIVRNDGNEDMILVEDVDPATVITDSDKIYFLRQETVGKKVNKSLYSMDVENYEIKKLIFNVNSIKEYDESNIYVNKNEVEKWQIVKTTEDRPKLLPGILLSLLSLIFLIILIVQISNYGAQSGTIVIFVVSLIITIAYWIYFAYKKANPKRDIKTYNNLYSLNKYYIYNKVLGEMNNVLTIGKPDFNELYIKNKQPYESYTFNLVKIENKYYRSNVVKAGANFTEQKSKIDAEFESKSKSKFNFKTRK